MNRLKLFIASIALGLITGCSSPTDLILKLDDSALEPFWEITDLLVQDIEPDTTLWNKMFATEGYKTLTENEFPVKWIQDYMRIGLMPSQQGELLMWKQRGFWDIKFCIHMRDVYEKREELKTFILDFKNQDAGAVCLDLMKEWWPADLSINEEELPFAILVFDKDARGYSPVLFDLWYAHEQHLTGDFIYTMAHEMHHYYRNQQLSFVHPPDSLPEANIVWMLNQIHCEGLADQINKDHSFEHPMNAKQTVLFQNYLKDTPSHIMKLDSLLMAYDQGGDNKADLARAIGRAAPNSGHPMGYFMSKIILENQSREYLLEDIGNPFAFFRRYNEAAKESVFEVPVFSAKSIKLLSELEDKWKQS
jgi:hypothetical protein